MVGAPDHQAFREAADFLSKMRRPLLISHSKPDGDALGALVAMRALLGANGVAASALLFDEIPHRYALFHRFEVMPVLGRDRRLADLEDCDGVVALDTCAYAQLKPVEDWLRARTFPLLAVDHHVTRDELADHYLIDESAAATCLILYEWAGDLGWSIPPDARDALFVGMAMDTGWFAHSNTESRVLAAAGALAASGAKPHELHQALFQAEAPGRLRLLGAALKQLELFGNDRLAVMALTKSDFDAAGATSADTEDIVNEPLRIESAVVSVLLVQQEDGLVRASFRSKPPLGAGEGGTDQAGPDVDVAAVAQHFGGGGHKRAGGARIPGSLPEVRAAVIKHLRSVTGF